MSPDHPSKMLIALIPTRRKLIKSAIATYISCLWSPSWLLGKNTEENTVFDFIVVGSGAAGMTAALRAAHLGLKVLVIEKASTFGGSTARSGGGIWIRNNSINQASGLEDSFEEAKDYLEAVVDGESSLENQAAFLEQGPKMIDFVMEASPLKFRRMPGYSDYYPELYGGKPEGASIEPDVLDGKLLGKHLSELARPYLAVPPGLTVFGADYKWLCLAKVSFQGAKRAAEAVSRYIESKLKGKRPLTMGQALAAGLRVGLLNKKVDLWLNSEMIDLQTDADSKVTKIRINKKGRQIDLEAKKGILLAAGGFEHNLAMRKKYQKSPISTKWTLGAKTNTGEAIELGKSLGAQLSLMDDAWWGPSILLEKDQPYFCLSERSLPGSILVNQNAERFVNESATYHDVVLAMYEQPKNEVDIPIYLITDQTYRNRYLFKDVLPGLPLPKAWYESGALVKADTIEELAGKIELDPDKLIQTITRFNSFAETGRDQDFKRGDSAYDRYYADPGVKPNPSLAAIKKGPFYAFKMVAGDLGTKGGLLTDERARVLDKEGRVIPGLYAAGNCSSAVMGRSYAGAGSTIGPAMTFGFIAADDLIKSNPH